MVFFLFLLLLLIFLYSCIQYVHYSYHSKCEKNYRKKNDMFRYGIFKIATLTSSKVFNLGESYMNNFLI